MVLGMARVSVGAQQSRPPLGVRTRGSVSASRQHALLRAGLGLSLSEPLLRMAPRSPPHLGLTETTVQLY